VSSAERLAGPALGGATRFDALRGRLVDDDGLDRCGPKSAGPYRRTRADGSVSGRYFPLRHDDPGRVVSGHAAWLHFGHAQQFHAYRRRPCLLANGQADWAARLALAVFALRRAGPGVGGVVCRLVPQSAPGASVRERGGAGAAFFPGGIATEGGLLDPGALASDFFSARRCG